MLGPPMHMLEAIIGYCSSSSTCAIESTVNMTTITFSGDIGSSKTYLGGIAGSTDYWYTTLTQQSKSCSYTSDVGVF